MADLLAQINSKSKKKDYVVGYISYEAAPAFLRKTEVLTSSGRMLLCFTVRWVETSYSLTYEEMGAFKVAWFRKHLQDYEKKYFPDSPSFVRGLQVDTLSIQARLECQSFYKFTIVW